MKILIKEVETVSDIASSAIRRTTLSTPASKEAERAKQDQEEQEKKEKEEQQQIDERSKKAIETIKEIKTSDFFSKLIKYWNSLFQNYAQFTPDGLSKFLNNDSFKLERQDFALQHYKKIIDISDQIKLVVNIYLPKKDSISKLDPNNDFYQFEVADKFNFNFEPQNIIGIKSVCYQLYFTDSSLKEIQNTEILNFFNENVVKEANNFKLMKGTILVNPNRKVKKVFKKPAPATPTPAAPAVTESIIHRWKLIANIK